MLLFCVLFSAVRQLQFIDISLIRVFSFNAHCYCVHVILHVCVSLCHHQLLELHGFCQRYNIVSISLHAVPEIMCHLMSLLVHQLAPPHWRTD